MFDSNVLSVENTAYVNTAIPENRCKCVHKRQNRLSPYVFGHLNLGRFGSL